MKNISCFIFEGTLFLGHPVDVCEGEEEMELKDEEKYLGEIISKEKYSESIRWNFFSKNLSQSFNYTQEQLICQ